MSSSPEGLKRLVKGIMPAPLLRKLSETRVRRGIRRRFGPDDQRPGAVRSVLETVRHHRTVLFYPQVPWPDHVSFKLCVLLRYRVVADPHRHFDVAIKHLRGTHSDSPLLDQLPIARDQIVNGHSIDVSKQRVQQAFATVFGYALAVDPLTHAGAMVEKSDENARHDGRVVEGPLEASAVDPAKVYQRLIRNESERDGCILDHRVPVHGGRIPLVYRKHRRVETRFKNQNEFVELATPDEAFSTAEQELLLRLADELAIDVGELDVLRDADRRLYVVDVANTPAGPPGGLPEAEGRAAMQIMAASYERVLDDWIERRNRSQSLSGEGHRARH